MLGGLSCRGAFRVSATLCRPGWCKATVPSSQRLLSLSGLAQPPRSKTMGGGQQVCGVASSATGSKRKMNKIEDYRKAWEEQGLGMATLELGHGTDYHHPLTGKDGYCFLAPLSFLGPKAVNGALHGDNIKSLGGTKALIVTPEGVANSPIMVAVDQLLIDAGIPHVPFTGVTANPTADEVHEGARKFQEEGCDFLISVGGGSPHDAAKGIDIIASHGGRIQDYEGHDKLPGPLKYPLVCVNTTGGTGAEITRFLVITDPDRHVKMTIIDWRVTPSLAVDDPYLHVFMGKALTAASGMDALTHAVEAYVSKASFPVTDANALHAITLIKDHLPVAYADPENLRARDMMSYAAYCAGLAFNAGGLGLVHAMSHQVGGMYNLPHGFCNAVLMPVVEGWNAQAVPLLFVDLAIALGHDDNQIKLNPPKAIAAVVNHIRVLSEELLVPENLKVMGVDPADFPKLAEGALKDQCIKTNPAQPTKEDIIHLYQLAYDQTY